MSRLSCTCLPRTNDWYLGCLGSALIAASNHQGQLQYHQNFLVWRHCFGAIFISLKPAKLGAGGRGCLLLWWGALLPVENLGGWDRGTVGRASIAFPFCGYGFKPPVHSGASVRRSGAQTASESLRSQADQLAVPDSPSVVAGDMIGDTPQHPSTRPSLSLNILTMLIALRYYKKRPPALSINRGFLRFPERLRSSSARTGAAALCYPLRLCLGHPV